MDDKLRTCFVISPFGEPYDTYFTSILKPSIEDAGLYAVRGDSLYRPSTIIDDIWDGIRRSELLIAELTGRNANVFYELGLAHAISKPVILISESIEDIPFDLRAIRVLLYDKDHPEWGSRLKQSLSRSIGEVLTSPLGAIPATFKSLTGSKPPSESELVARVDVLEGQVRLLVGQSSIETVASHLGSPDEVYESRGTFIKLSTGMRIFHRNYGLGTVLQVHDSMNERQISYTVNFDNAGTRQINQWFARMQPVP